MVDYDGPTISSEVEFSFIFDSAMTLSDADAAFLAEVENFLVVSDLPELPSINNNNDDAIDSSSPWTDSAENKSLPVARIALPSTRKTQDTSKVESKQRRSLQRERRKLERENLLEEAEKLATTLLEVQSSKKEATMLSAKVWETLAHRQLQSRLTSEEEQRFLYAAINSKAAAIQELCYHLTGPEPNDSFSQCKRIRVEPSDTAFYEAFLQELDSTYAEADKALLSCAMDAIPGSWKSFRRSWREDDTTGFLLNTSIKVLPIEFRSALDNLWHAARLPHRQEGRQHFDGVEDHGNTAGFKFRVTRRISGRVMSMMQRSVTRRYEENSRLVLVWRSFLEGEGDFTGMHANETGWTELIPSDRGTLMRTCIHHVPMHFSSVVKPEVEQFTSMVLDSVSDDGDEIAKRIEKLNLTGESQVADNVNGS